MLFLTRSEVEALLDPDELIEAVASAMVEVSSGRVSMPPRVAAHVSERAGLLGGMLAYVPALGVLEAKLVSLFPQNAGGPLPTHQAIIAAFDPSTGEPAALLDGTAITALRTAAGSALATRLLARENASVLAIVGTGVQARSHAQFVSRVRNFAEIRIAGRDYAKTRRAAAEITAELGRDVIAVSSHADAIRGADVVCATTNCDEPVVRRESLAPGAHVNSVGMPRAEVDVATIRDSVVAVESRDIIFLPPPAGAAELIEAREREAIDTEDVSEIGELLIGSRHGRTSPEQITLYKSVGIAAQDAAAVALILKKARDHGIGREITL